MAKIQEQNQVVPIEGKDVIAKVAAGTLLRSVGCKNPDVEINLYFLKTDEKETPLIELGYGELYNEKSILDYIFIIVPGQLTLAN